MFRITTLAALAACTALAAPTLALAGGAGDDQYLDPLQGLTGSHGQAGGSTPSKPKDSSGSSTSTSDGQSASAPAPVVQEPAPAVNGSKKNAGSKTKAAEPIARTAVDINALSGIGPLVAVPVKHVTLVLGDIAHGRG